MKTAIYGRMVFGASAVVFGGLALLWHDADTWQNLQHIWKLPFGGILGDSLMIAQIAAGFGIQFPRTRRAASLILGVVYLSFSLACVPDIVAATNIYERFGGSFFLFFSMFCGAIALSAGSESSVARARILGLVARIGFGVCAISFTLGQALLLGDTAGLVPKWIPPSQFFWATLTTIAFALAAIAILTHRNARLAIGLMTVMLALFGVLVWIPRIMAHPEAHFNWSECLLDFLITGASWMVTEQESAQHLFKDSGAR